MTWEHRQLERQWLRLQYMWGALHPCCYQQWWLHVHAVDSDDDGGGTSQQWQQSRKMLAGCT
jgi:hypothetical protein